MSFVRKLVYSQASTGHLNFSFFRHRLKPGTPFPSDSVASKKKLIDQLTTMQKGKYHFYFKSKIHLFYIKRFTKDHRL